jgi:hypothetical protein
MTLTSFTSPELVDDKEQANGVGSFPHASFFAFILESLHYSQAPGPTGILLDRNSSRDRISKARSRWFSGCGYSRGRNCWPDCGLFAYRSGSDRYRIRSASCRKAGHRTLNSKDHHPTLAYLSASHRDVRFRSRQTLCGRQLCRHRANPPMGAGIRSSLRF